MNDQNPDNALPVELVGDTSTTTDVLIGRVIYLVGAIALVALVGIIVLATRGQAIPDVLQNLAVGSLTGLTALLVARRS